MRFLTFLLIAGAVWCAPALELDGVVARVGTETILRSDVLAEMRNLNIMDASRFTEFRNELIDRKLILKAAAESKMTMQDWVVENRVREIIKKAFDGDRNRLIENLSAQRISYPEWHARMKENMIVGAMRWNVVDKNVTASPAAMRQQYARHPERYATEHGVTVSVILLKPEEKGRREEILAALKDSTFAAQGGKLYENIKPEDYFKSEVVEALELLPVGSTSHWIEIDGWSFLLRKESETMGHQLTFAEAYDQIAADVKEAEAKRLYTAWLERLRAESYIKVY